MEKTFIQKMNSSLQYMRAKVVATKGQSVKGLSLVITKKEKMLKEKNRGNKEWKS